MMTEGERENAFKREIRALGAERDASRSRAERAEQETLVARALTAQEAFRSAELRALYGPVKAERDALRLRVAALEPFARFGQWCFEAFWNDAEPGDLDGGDLQEQAVECGLLRRRESDDERCVCDDPEGGCGCLFPTVSSRPVGGGK